MDVHKSRAGRAIDEDASTILLRRRKRPSAPSLPEARRRPSSLGVEVTTGRHRGTRLRLFFGDNIVGRNLDASIALIDEGISRRHAVITVDDRERISVLDLNSTNGTTVNGERVRVGMIQDGDRVGIGRDVVLEVCEFAGRPAAADEHEGREGLVEPGPGAQVAEPDAPRRRPGVGARRPDSYMSKARARDLCSGEAKSCWGYSTEALRAYERLLRLREEKEGADHVSVAEILDVMGQALLQGGELERALSCHQRVERIHQAQVPMSVEDVVHSVVRQAQCELLLEHNEAALHTYERAERLLVMAELGGYELASVRLAIARLLWHARRQLDRALNLARDARDVIERGGNMMAPFRDDARECVTVIEGALAERAKRYTAVEDLPVIDVPEPASSGGRTPERAVLSLVPPHDADGLAPK